MKSHDDAENGRDPGPRTPPETAAQAASPTFPQTSPEISPENSPENSEDELDERRRLRRLQMMMDMVTSVISQDASLTVDEAASLVADSKRAALAMFPGKELAYNLIYRPRFQRLMRERYRIQ